MMKKWIGILALVLAVALGGIPAFAGSSDSGGGTPVGNLYAEADGQRIDVLAVNGAAYLFLPASSDPETTQILGGETEALPAVQVLQAALQPTIYITSSDRMNEGRSFVDAAKTNVTTGSMMMVDAEGTVLYEGELTQIKARGNSTFNYAPKKSYQIKLGKKTDLLGTGEKVKTWVLLAAYHDATKVHDKTIKDLAASLGMDYTASAGWVNVYYDGEYRGLYELSEKNSVGSTGVDIADMEEAYEQVNEDYGTDPVTAEARNRFGNRFSYTRGLFEPENITGGYLLEINGSRYDEASGFITRKNKGVNVKSPEWAGPEAMTYISEFYQEFEEAVYAQDVAGNYTGYNAQTGKYYYDYVDRDSLVKFFMLKDLTRNTDSFYSSTFFYKDKDADKLVCGPVWDQELIFGTGWTAPVSSNGYYRQYLEEALVKIPDFQEAVRAYYQSTFREQAETLLGEEGILARNTAAISDSVDMDHILWPFVRSGYPKGKNHLWDKATTYADVTDNMTDWVRNRLTYLDSRLGEGTDGAIDPDSGGNQGGQGHDPAGDNPTGQGEDPGNNGGGNGGGNGGNGGGGGGVKPDDPTPVPTVTPTEEEPLFEDVPGDAYFADPVKWAVKQGITNGITGTRFGPDLSCTRAQMTAFLWRAAGSPEPAAADNPFSDVEAGSYYEKAVLWAVEKGITNGTSETTFSPKAIVTRGQSVTFLYRMLASSAGEGVTEGDGEGEFVDVSQNAYYYDAVRWAAQAGVTTGKTDKLFAPDDSCTRAQIVTFLYRAMAE